MEKLTYRFERAASDRMIVYPQGIVNRDTAGALWNEIVGHMDRADFRQIIVDCREVSAVDSIAFVVFQNLEKRIKEQGLAFKIENLPEEIDRFIQYLREQTSGEIRVDKKPSPPGPVTRLGERLLDAKRALAGWLRRDLCETLDARP